jgi:sugar lactone lactonase YvrE
MFGAGRIATYHMGGGGAGVSSGPAGWTLTGASYASKSFSVNSQDTTPHGVQFKSDGTKMYMVGAANDSVYQYSLSTAWDISTASYDSVSFSISGQETSPTDFFFSADGTKFYTCGIGTSFATMRQYNLSTAWNLSTASYSNLSYNHDSNAYNPGAIFFRPNGTTFYIADRGSDAVKQFTLSTAWNLSTASYASKSFSISGQEASVSGIHFKSDGTKMFLAGSTNDTAYQYSLSTAWDISTASYDSVSLSLTSQSTDSNSLTINDDGTKMYVANDGNNTVYQYTLG